MFAWWGRMVYQFRYAVIGIMVALCLGGGIYGASLGQHVTQSGFYDDTSQSVKASVLADDVYGRDRLSHIVAVLDAPEGKKANDPQWSKKMKSELDKVVADHPDQILYWRGYLESPTGDPTTNAALANDGTRTFVVMPLKGDDDDTILKNYQVIAPDLQTVDDGKIKLAGLQPIASELTGTIGEDQKRAEVAAIPLVAVVLFFVFGTVIAASLPAIIGGLTIMGALGIMRLAAEFTPVHFFAQPVVTLIGLGIAIDYGLFIVSRFREELAEGYDTEAAVRRTMMTSGRTVMFSAVIIVASSVPLLLFPQGFLKSITYAIIASVMLAAIMSNTVLIAALAVLGHRVDSIGVGSLTKFALPNTIHSDPSNPKKNTLALAAIPTGILLPPVGIAVGHIARNQIKRTGEQGANLAYLGLVFAYLGTYGGLAYGCYALRDAGVIEGSLFYILLGIVIFCATVTAILVLARFVPLIRRITISWLNFLAEKTQKTKTREEVEKGFWGTLVNKVMKRPGLFALPIVIVMILLVIPLGQLALGGISEKYLPPDNAVRQAQNAFDSSFPGYRTEKLTLVVQGATPQQLDQVKNEAAQITGFTGTWDERPVAPDVDDPKIPIGANGEPSSLPVEGPAVRAAERSRGAQRCLQEDRRAPRHVGPEGGHPLGRRHTGAGTGQHPQPLREAATDGGGADPHDDGADVPGVRVTRPADQGRVDECAHPWVDDGHPDVDVRRRTRLGTDELHAAAPDGADDRFDHRGHLGSVDRLRGVPGIPHGGGQGTRAVHG